MTEFGLNDLRQLAITKVHTRRAADMIADRFGAGDGIVLCLRSAASLIDDIYDSNSTHVQKAEIAIWVRAQLEAEEMMAVPGGVPPRKGRAGREAAPLPGAPPPSREEVHTQSGDGT